MAKQKSEKKSYPRLPRAHWWALRRRFKRSIPGVVTDSYLAATLNMKPNSARANVLPYLREIGLIDEDGKTQQQMATAWRDDHRYPDVCREIRERIYPGELLSAAPNPVEDRGAAERWFANNTGHGSAAVRGMLQFYTVLMEADPSKQPATVPRKKATRRTKTAVEAPSRAARPATSSHKNKLAAEAPLSSGDASRPPHRPPEPGLPGVSIRLEIHISADATPDQIDKLFESMAKHIYKK